MRNLLLFCEALELLLFCEELELPHGTVAGSGGEVGAARASQPRAPDESGSRELLPAEMATVKRSIRGACC